MKRYASFLALVLLSTSVQGQTLPDATLLPPPPGPWQLPAPPSGAVCSAPTGLDNGFLTGNHNFPNFINFISSPIQNIDPRAVTALYPIFESAGRRRSRPCPMATCSVWRGRDGGPIGPPGSRPEPGRLRRHAPEPRPTDAHHQRSPLPEPPCRHPARLFDIAAGGERDGLLNLGGFAQYTFIEDVPNQFLLTGGLRLEVPCGAHEVFQGYGPAEMSTYLTAGKEFGKYHVLGTVGYEFPIGPGSDNEQFFYANFHFDRQLFGWLYPLVEFNCLDHTVSVGRNFELPTRRGFADFNDFSATGNSVFLSAGANAVIVPEALGDRRRLFDQHRRAEQRQRQYRAPEDDDPLLGGGFQSAVAPLQFRLRQNTGSWPNQDTASERGCGVFRVVTCS